MVYKELPEKHGLVYWWGGCREGLSSPRTINSPASNMSLKFENPSSFLLSGASGCGKTFWILKFIDHIHQICPEIKRIFYYYEIWQKCFESYTDKVIFRQGPPDLAKLKEAKDSLVILDDLMFSDPVFLCKIYTIYAHHYHFTPVITTQNLFHKAHREISLNTHFVVVFKNCRDVSQISYFLRQIFPEKYKAALLAYKDATDNPRGYLLVDLRTTTPESDRLRTNIFPDQLNYVYQ